MVSDPIFLKLSIDYNTYSNSVDESEPSGLFDNSESGENLFDDGEEPSLLGDALDDVFEDGEGEE